MHKVGRNILIIMILIITLFVWVSFADSWWTWNAPDASKIAEFLRLIVNFLSWFWMIPAIMAWKLLTNDFVMWEFIHMDKYLWILWNFMKNMANFTVWFIFIFVVLKSFFDFKEDATSVIKKFLPKILVSSVLIQASWFILAALIDLSVIMVVAVASFPQQFINQNEWVKNHVERLTEITPKVCTFDMHIDKDNLSNNFAECKSTWDAEKINFTEMFTDASWPLLFLWYTVYRMQDMVFLSSKNQDASSLTAWLILNLIVVLMFFIPIFLLMIVNLIRIFWIRIYAALSPFIVLDNVFWWKVLWEKNKAFKLWNIIWLIFQPVAVIWVLSLCVIMVIWLHAILTNKWQSTLWKTDEDMQRLITGLWFEEECINNWSDCKMKNEVAETTIKYSSSSIQEKLWDFVWWWLWYLFMVLFTSVMLWTLIQVWFKTTEITSKFTGWAFKFMGDIWKTIPLVPWTNLSLWALQQAQSTFKSKTMWRLQAWQSDTIWEQFKELFWLEWTWLTNTEQNKFKEILNLTNPNSRTNQFFEYSRELAKNKQLSLRGNPQWREEVERWISKDVNSQDSVLKRLSREDEWLAKLVEQWNYRKIFDDPMFRRFFDYMMITPNANATEIDDIQRIWWSSQADIYWKTY